MTSAYRTADAMAATGATYRQADHAARAGIASVAKPGSGNPRTWTFRDIVRLGVYVSVSRLLTQRRGGVKTEDIAALLASGDVLNAGRLERALGPASIVVDLTRLRRDIRRHLSDGAHLEDLAVRRQATA